MGDRQRRETGEYVETVTLEKVLSALESIATPVAKFYARRAMTAPVATTATPALQAATR